MSSQLSKLVIFQGGTSGVYLLGHACVEMSCVGLVCISELCAMSYSVAAVVQRWFTSLLRGGRVVSSILLFAVGALPGRCTEELE
jgi:hypothetical protein